jgi:hypothetical protein
MFECRINTASSCVSSNRDKPIQNAYAESFIGKFRDECLNENWFGSLGDAPHDRSLEAALQRTPAAQLARLLAPQCFCHLPEKS